MSIPPLWARTNNIKPIIRDGRIIDMSFGFAFLKDGKSKYRLYFRDSYLLLPDYLKNLANNFNVIFLRSA